MNEGTVTIGIDYYTHLIEEKTQYDTRIEALKRLTERDSYHLAEQIRDLFGWDEPAKEEE